MIYDRVIKRMIDLLLSGMAMVVLSPVYLILGVLVRKRLGIGQWQKCDLMGAEVCI